MPALVLAALAVELRPALHRHALPLARALASLGPRFAWFFSLDASSRLAVEGARLSYRLPYFHAHIRQERAGERVAFRSERTAREAHAAALEVSYAPVASPRPAQRDSLEAFLAERYCLCARHGRRLLRAEIHHPPWQLRDAEAELPRNTTPPLQVSGEPLLHLGERQDVLFWRPDGAG